MENINPALVTHSPEDLARNYSEASTSVHEDPFNEDEFGDIIREENKPEAEETSPENLEFLTEENMAQYKKLCQLSSDDLTPKRIRNFALENSINRNYWEYDNFNLDPL